jgi:hypothetical protein
LEGISRGRRLMGIKRKSKRGRAKVMGTEEPRGAYTL